MKETFENLRVWKLLEAISRNKSITQASIELDISLSNASKLINKLEKELNHSLINREKKPIELTDYAQKLLPLVANLIFEWSRLETAATTLDQNKDSGRVIFSLSTTSVSAHVLEFINEFKKLHPASEIELRAGLNHLAIKEGKADVVMVSYNPDDKDLVKLPSGKCFNFMVASPAYLKKYGTPKTIKDLLNHKIILRRKDFYPECHMLYNGTQCFDLDSLEWFDLNSNKKKETLRHFKGSDYPKFKKIYGDDYSAYVSSINGEGISIDLPVSLLEEKLKDQSLIPVLPGWHRAPWDKLLIYSKEAENSTISLFAHWYREKEIRDSIKRWNTCFTRYGIPKPTSDF